MRRRHLTRDQKFIVSAVAVGLLLAAGHGQAPPQAAAATPRRSGATDLERLANVALGQRSASTYGWTGSRDDLPG